MKLSDFYTLTGDQLESMDVQSLKKLVSEQGQKLNKRISNIKGNPKANKAAVKSVEVSGGRFGVSGKDTKRALIAEAKREQRFMDKKTSTVKGAVKANQRSGKDVTGMTSKQYAKKKAAERIKKEKAEEVKRKGNAGKRRKQSKSQKRKWERKRREYEKEEEKKYNRFIGEAWDTFHKWKEYNPALAYNKEKVKQAVNEYAVTMPNDREQVNIENSKLIRKIFNSVEYDEAPSDLVWQTVSSTPFTDPENFNIIK